jgi:predicted phage-related endonuclease
MSNRLFELEIEMQFLRRTRHLGMSDEARKARKSSLGGSDAKIIMSGDQEAIERLWREKRGEQESEDMSEILLVQLGNITEALNADWFEFQKQLYVTDEQQKVFYPDWEKAHATLDGLVRETPDSKPIGLAEFKFMFPFGFDKQKAFDKYFPQCQHNMMVTGMPLSYLSIMTGAAQHIIVEIEADIFYQVDLLKALKDFWECVETGRTPGNPVVEIPLIDRIKVIDMSDNNQWADMAATIAQTKTAADKHAEALKGIKKLFPGDAKSASGKGITINLSKDGKRLIKIDDEVVQRADKDNGWFPPAPANDEAAAKPKKATRKKAAANSNDEAKADAA